MTLPVTAECVDDLLNEVHQALLNGGIWNTQLKEQILRFWEST